MSLTLHVGPAVYAWLQDISIRAQDRTDLIAPELGRPLASFGAVPVIMEYGTWPHGRWEAREDGETVASGRPGRITGLGDFT
jgi:hypothetical protein